MVFARKTEHTKGAVPVVVTVKPAVGCKHTTSAPPPKRPHPKRLQNPHPHASAGVHDEKPVAKRLARRVGTLSALGTNIKHANAGFGSLFDQSNQLFKCPLCNRTVSRAMCADCGRDFDCCITSNKHTDPARRSHVFSPSVVFDTDLRNYACACVTGSKTRREITRLATAAVRSIAVRCCAGSNMSAGVPVEKLRPLPSAADFASAGYRNPTRRMVEYIQALAGLTRALPTILAEHAAAPAKLNSSLRRDASTGKVGSVARATAVERVLRALFKDLTFGTFRKRRIPVTRDGFRTMFPDMAQSFLSPLADAFSSYVSDGERHPSACATSDRAAGSVSQAAPSASVCVGTKLVPIGVLVSHNDPVASALRTPLLACIVRNHNAANATNGHGREACLFVDDAPDGEEGENNNGDDDADDDVEEDAATGVVGEDDAEDDADCAGGGGGGSLTSSRSWRLSPSSLSLVGMSQPTSSHGICTPFFPTPTPSPATFTHNTGDGGVHVGVRPTSTYSGYAWIEGTSTPILPANFHDDHADFGAVGTTTATRIPPVDGAEATVRIPAAHGTRCMCQTQTSWSACDSAGPQRARCGFCSHIMQSDAFAQLCRLNPEQVIIPVCRKGTTNPMAFLANGNVGARGRAAGNDDDADDDDNANDDCDNDANDDCDNDANDDSGAITREPLSAVTRRHLDVLARRMTLTNSTRLELERLFMIAIRNAEQRAAGNVATRNEPVVNDVVGNVATRNEPMVNNAVGNVASAERLFPTTDSR